MPAKLLTRHWLITDANGKVQEVRGEGVVGEQPHLQPGQGFRYSSGTVIETPVGAMEGTLLMMADDGERFDAPIAPFRLAMPGRPAVTLAPRAIELTRYAIGDVQGCHDELRALVERIGFSADRDQLWFAGDLVNRGPKSLEVLRYVRSLGDNAVTVLGNHDLHLLALAFGTQPQEEIRRHARVRCSTAQDRDALLEWLMTPPARAFRCRARRPAGACGADSAMDARQDACQLSREVQAAMRADPRKLFDEMYGEQAGVLERASCSGADRLRFAINVLTRMRVCTREGCIDMEMKGGPDRCAAAVSRMVRT